VCESREFDLEKYLFAELTFIHRSPENFIKWTQTPHEEDEGEG
jgi:hypothetical protein